MKLTLYLLGLLIISSPIYAQIAQLQTKIEQVIKSKKAIVGVGLYEFGSQQTITINGDKHMPMQSVYKFHVALAVLREVDKGRLKLNQKMHVKKSDLVPGLHSPMGEAYPNGEVDLPLADIIRYMVADSDGSACDYLFRLLGGPRQVEAFIHQLGIQDVAIRNTEEMMQAQGNWNVQYTNWTTPTAMLSLLKLVYKRKILSASSHDFLWKVMVGTTTGENRLKKLLPAGTVVAHKTGTSGTTKAGLMGAVNDAGFIALPNGKYMAISVFVMNSTERIEMNERIIAEIAKVAYDHFVRGH
ncbi:class A beta-lactamase, subclass A2 [Spirosoma endbachense]|uniref:beta-lactamase n=1 Tax=Spirosoma endbachense TaxID=2666025 RepID=A0A6P1VXI2_9BACT|nr:class A beta-lactamase, subclass A2 [Spirosoma endbachense]QHV97823.1 class A beta-lactamase, subclass A2 [Spirosoma endbachense]